MRELSRGAEGQALAGEAFREGMARLGAAVHIVTTDGRAGRAGFTASAVCSVTDAPPTLLVCLNRSASVYAAIVENGVLAINTLTPEHQRLSKLFGGGTPIEERFAAGEWKPGETGSPMLDGALVSFDCRLSSCLEVGSHTVLICEVVGMTEPRSHDGLVYFHRAYHALGPTTALFDFKGEDG